MKLILVLLILFLLLPTCVFAFQNEPKEFRGIKWGSSAEVQKDLFLYRKDGDVSIYKRKNDKMQIGEVTGIKNIYYFFFKNKFYKVTIDLEDKDSIKNYTKLIENFEILYGAPSEREDQKGDFFINKPIITNRSWKGKMINVDTSFIMGFPDISYRYPASCDVNYRQATTSVICAHYEYIPIAKEYYSNKREERKLKKQKNIQEKKKIQKQKAENVKKDL